MVKLVNSEDYDSSSFGLIALHSRIYPISVYLTEPTRFRLSLGEIIGLLSDWPIRCHILSKVAFPLVHSSLSLSSISSSPFFFAGWIADIIYCGAYATISHWVSLMLQSEWPYQSNWFNLVNQFYFRHFQEISPLRLPGQQSFLPPTLLINAFNECDRDLVHLEENMINGIKNWIWLQFFSSTLISFWLLPLRGLVLYCVSRHAFSIHPLMNLKLIPLPINPNAVLSWPDLAFKMLVLQLARLLFSSVTSWISWKLVCDLPTFLIAHWRSTFSTFQNQLVTASKFKLTMKKKAPISHSNETTEYENGLEALNGEFALSMNHQLEQFHQDLIRTLPYRAILWRSFSFLFTQNVARQMRIFINLQMASTYLESPMSRSQLRSYSSMHWIWTLITTSANIFGIPLFQHVD